MKDLLEGRLQLPGDHVRPLDMLEEGMRLNTKSQRHTSGTRLAKPREADSTLHTVPVLYLTS